MAIFIPVIGAAALGFYYANKNVLKESDVTPVFDPQWKKLLKDIEKVDTITLKKVNVDKIYVPKNIDEELKNVLEIRRKKIDES